MPGIVGIIAVGLALCLALVIGLITSLIFKRFLAKGWLGAIGLGTGFGVLVSGGLLYASFRPAQWEVTQSQFVTRFPELVKYRADFRNGLSFQDGLSDGEFYHAQFSPAMFDELLASAKARRKKSQSLGALMNMPDWYRGENCEGVIHFNRIFQPVKSERGYLDRFALHFCPASKELFADYVRV